MAFLYTGSFLLLLGFQFLVPSAADMNINVMARAMPSSVNMCTMSPDYNDTCTETCGANTCRYNQTENFYFCKCPMEPSYGYKKSSVELCSNRLLKARDYYYTLSDNSSIRRPYLRGIINCYRKCRKIPKAKTYSARYCSRKVGLTNVTEAEKFVCICKAPVPEMTSNSGKGEEYYKRRYTVLRNAVDAMYRQILWPLLRYLGN